MTAATGESDIVPNQDETSRILDAEERLLELHAEFRDEATTLDRLSARATDFLGQPLVALGIAAAAVGWMAANALALRWGGRAWDPPPFEAMQGFGTAAAVVIASLILAGQRRDDEAARRRSQLTLHLSAQSEQKIAKLIELVEEQRRHNPMLPNRDDAQAAQMATPADPRQVLDRVSQQENERKT